MVAAYAELRRFLVHRLRNVDDAADVAQASFERVYACALSGTVATPRALLFHTARTLCIDRGRHRQVEARALEALHAAAPVTAPSVERVVADRQALARITSRLQRLPEKRRDAFVLVRVYGCTHAEAAAQLGLSVAAIEKHVVRATLDCADLFLALQNDGAFAHAG
ncbi:MAG: sigma-70 family RNA polymerase sigma factor [Burkholderiales bacterium]|nr:sigma-70 family RNA polymerase sigma factor [Burkholderiales bacterium]